MERWRRFVVPTVAASLALAAPAPAAAPSAAGESPDGKVDVAAIDEVFAPWNRSDGPGCVCAVSDASRVLLERAYGMANLELGVRLTPSSVFYVASVAKQFTAASVALLAERGLLSLDDDARDYLPQLGRIEAPVTIRQLAQHTSGIRDYFGLLRLAGDHSLDYLDQGKVLDMLGNQRTLQFEPGSLHEYSNSNYVLLAELVRRISGTPFTVFTSREIFAPLGMTMTHFQSDHTKIVPGRVASYRVSDDGFHRFPMGFDVMGDGGLLSTARDLTAWGRNLLRPKLGGRLLRAELARPGVTSNGGSFAYGLGHRLDEYRGLPTIGHTGSFKGFRTRLVALPEHALVVAVLCNVDDGNAKRLSEAVLDALIPQGGPPAATRPEERAAAEAPRAELSSEDLARWTGHYWSDAEAHTRDIYVKDGTLFYGRGGVDSALSPLSVDRFTMPGFGIPILLDFWREPDGERRLRVRVADLETVLYREYTPIDPARFAPGDFTGRYASDELRAAYSIRRDEDSLWLVTPNGARARLQPIMEDRLLATVDEHPYALRFGRDPDGAVEGFAVDSGWIRGLRLTRTDER